MHAGLVCGQRDKSTFEKQPSPQGVNLKEEIGHSWAIGYTGGY